MSTGKLQYSEGDTAAGPPARRGRPRMVSDEERRKAILQAAYAAFVELGFARTTTAIVAAKAKVSKRSIYELFENKTRLFAEVVREHRHVMLDLPRPADEDLPPLETLSRIFRLDIPDEEDVEREAVLRLIVRESQQLPELSDYLYENGIIRAREELIEWLDRENCRGRIRSEDTLVCAGMLMDIVFGALLPRRRLKTAGERTQRREHIRKRLEIFLRGIGAM
ncbi:TetR/AcrR family transcriptional regulator [Rhizobiaceae bacterium BDR2-2]|uniref:TetR/AcrR family transcriptional regulator n=1 Tax=Ectorhizobium quercum TaxID=2965071 RepID=A0AAE3N441_9HYPH|nr:TetR/AcrR family transcriptional regulator [Ectorhizobium quercum]MCX8999846.1 TetR/AcrR family transcriptional regulator [Ectorhizobium quercum]